MTLVEVMRSTAEITKYRSRNVGRIYRMVSTVVIVVSGKTGRDQN